jgi:hypothetical protein
MAKAARLERLEGLRVELEAEYLAALIAALKATAAGSWRLFDHNQDRTMRTKVAPVIAALTDLAEQIGDARDRLGLEPFDLHREFMASRGRAAPSAVGEPKQARAWLDRLSVLPAARGG